MSILLGTTLSGRYRLEERIGAGGMSTVYRALDETLQRQVAIKLMNREVSSDSDQLERFRREARAVAQLSHPHVVGVIDAGEDETRRTSFRVRRRRDAEGAHPRLGRFRSVRRWRDAIRICLRLASRTQRHIVHRDVKL